MEPKILSIEGDDSYEQEDNNNGTIEQNTNYNENTVLKPTPPITLIVFGTVFVISLIGVLVFGSKLLVGIGFLGAVFLATLITFNPISLLILCIISVSIKRNIAIKNGDTYYSEPRSRAEFQADILDNEATRYIFSNPQKYMDLKNQAETLRTLDKISKNSGK